MEPTKESSDRNIEMWKRSEENAHEQASVAIAEAAAATEKLKTVKAELAIAEKQLAAIRAKIREIAGIAS